ncbi:hypothetical protein PG994_011839 [Apiospora phragmitis]|uniref:Ankyrin repeat protein n=1 Tax=Apiospora phragmitis TaxID=2905665 RepID=A0ABR1TTY6_9PEZI
MRGRDECAALLLSHGADVLAEDQDGNILLDLAEKYHNPSMERIIREHMESLIEELRSKADEERGRSQSVPGQEGMAVQVAVPVE